MKSFNPSLLVIFFTILFSCSTIEPELIIRHQITGPIETNCYLVYDNQTMEAALIDVGDDIDTLMQYIEENRLEIEYILCTHGHMDHIFNVPAMLERFPGAKTVIHKLDYNDLWTQNEWVKANMDAETLGI